MATLAEGQQYALTSHLNHSIDKSLIFVKLTDSALKAIEDYLNHKGSVCSNSKPSIQFRSNDSQGVISIPVKSSNVSEQRFSFTLSNVDAVEPQGSFECIRHTKHKSIESLGNVDYKLQIHANDDSYQKTKVKMAVVERESKKNSTKVIKASDPNVGRKVKVKRHLTPSRPAPHSQPAQAASQAQPQTGHNGYKSYSPPSLKLNGNTINGIPNDKTSVSNNSNGSSGSKFSSNYSNANLDINQNEPKKLLRQTVVQLLALRPFKKQELVDKLYLENITVDKKELTLVLNNISNFKDNVYELSKSAWSEVHMDWSDYTNEERELVKSRNPLLSTCSTQPTVAAKSPLSDCGSIRSVVSPMSAVNSPIGPKSPALKRSSDSVPTTAPSAAKKYKSLNGCSNPSDKLNGDSAKLKTNGYNHLLNGWANKPSSPERREPSVASLMNVTANSSLNAELKSSDSLSTTSQLSPDFNPLYLSQPQQFHNQTNGVTYLANDNSFNKSQSRHAFNRYKKNSYHPTIGNGSDSINSSPNSSPDSGTGSHDGSTLSSSNSYSCTNDDNQDFITKYQKIQNNEQRAQYKRDFYIEYEEYRRLHRYIENVATKFSELEIRLNTKVEGSDDWNRLMDQIVKEYEETKNCPKFQKCRKRMFYLHDKLAHIKSLVLDYDRNFHNNKEKNRFTHKSMVKLNPIS